MRARKLGRWVGRLVAVVAFGLGATVGTAAMVSADESPQPASPTVVQDEPAGPVASARNITWD